MKRLALLLVALSLPLALVACGGGDEEGDVIGADTSGAAQTLSVTALDFEFDPAELSAHAGEVTFELGNDGDAPHALAVRGNGRDDSSEVIDGGESTSFSLDLEDGTYEIYCPVDDHEEQGMVGTLAVGLGGDGDDATTHEDTTTGETETHEDEDDSGETETGETETGDSGGSGSDDATNY